MSGKTILFSSASGDVVFPITPTSIDSMAIGAGTPSTGAFTTLTATSFTGSLGASGTFVINGVTPVTVANAALTANSQVLITLKTVGGSVGAIPHLATVTPGTGFTVLGTAADTSTYNYTIVG